MSRTLTILSGIGRAKLQARYRELGILGHQPAFQGNAPWALAVLHNDTAAEGGGSTRGKPKKDFDTAWIDGRDPLYTRGADAWMAQIIADFGSDHAWQADAFFGNGTSWGAEEEEDVDVLLAAEHNNLPLPPDPGYRICTLRWLRRRLRRLGSDHKVQIKDPGSGDCGCGSGFECLVTD